MRLAKLGLLLLVVACDEGAVSGQRSGLEPALRPESDQRAPVELTIGEVHVDTDGVLWRRTNGVSTKLLDRTFGAPAILADGSIVISRRHAPGDTDLWIVPPQGEPRALAPAEGSDDMPLALPDGKVAFLSTRTTVASIWVIDPRTGALAQLTNRGLAAGRDMLGFVPTPMHRMSIEGSELRYEAAPGELWAVDVASGAARRVEVER